MATDFILATPTHTSLPPRRVPSGACLAVIVLVVRRRRRMVAVVVMVVAMVLLGVGPLHNSGAAPIEGQHSGAGQKNSG